jgi:hypothetical protein
MLATRHEGLFRPSSSTPNFPQCCDHGQGGYTDRTCVRTPYEPNKRVAAPTVRVSQASRTRCPAIRMELGPPPACAPCRGLKGLRRVRLNDVRCARPSGRRTTFPMPSPPADLAVRALISDSTDLIQDTTSSNRHCQDPLGFDSPAATVRNLCAKALLCDRVGVCGPDVDPHAALGHTFALTRNDGRWCVLWMCSSSMSAARM